MDDLVVVGGLVPSLLIDQGRYRSLTGRLRDAGFAMDRNEEGNATRQRWRIAGPRAVTVDFLIQPSLAGDRGGSLRNIEPDFAAIIAPGLALAFEDRQRVTIDGRTLLGEKASRQLWICGAGAFVVLKALAFDSRGENKDAYDLYYVVRNFGAGIGDLAEKIRPLLRDAEAQRALAILRRDFLDPEGVGPRRVADFLVGGPDDDVQADVAGFVSLLLDRCS